MKNNYVLGSSSEEIKRLKIQSSLFESLARDSLNKAGIGNGMSCADVGCGSGDLQE